MRRLIALVLLCSPAALPAQQSVRTISPGMTRAQVVAQLGAPATQRATGEFTYMFYSNNCSRECGMSDLVILHKDSVADAIFRSQNRHYAGASSSPEEVLPGEAIAADSGSAAPLTLRKDDARTPASPTQMKPPAKGSDTTPSIPATQAPMTPPPAQTSAPTTAPAPAKPAP